MTRSSSHTRIAIACQGGGSHTAFTAGVLTELVTDPRGDIRALSGTSGGAVCALLAWYGLLKGRPGDGVDRLAAFWENNTASGLSAAWLQAATMTEMLIAGGFGLVFEPTPYLNPFGLFDLEGEVGHDLVRLAASG